MNENLKSASEIFKERCGAVPDIALILGSGLGGLADELEDSTAVPYDRLPGFPVSTAPGHVSELAAGTWAGQRILIFRGRFHHYEGYSMEQVVYPVRFVRALGCRRLLLTNAAGAVNRNLAPGDLMLITDHINFTGLNPLRGGNDRNLGPRFPDLGGCWSKKLGSAMSAAATRRGIGLKKGVYCWFPGPSFETPAEIRMTEILGGDAVGMSTVPEAIAAAHCGISTVGISCISNMAAGILNQPITEEEVIAAGAAVRDEFTSLLREFLAQLPTDSGSGKQGGG